MESSASTPRRNLEKAAEGLVYSSESDRPFEFVDLGTATWPPEAEDITRLLCANPGDTIEERSLSDFFARHTTSTDPYDTETQKVRPRYESLVATIESELEGVRVFRAGSIEIDCWVLGRSPGGRIMGLRTVAVET